jgi:hypothetical protein
MMDNRRLSDLSVTIARIIVFHPMVGTPGDVQSNKQKGSGKRSL